MNPRSLKKILAVLVSALATLPSLAQLDWKWAEKAGGSGNDYAYDIYTDPWGNSYVLGTFSGTISIGTYSLSSAGGNDLYIAKYNTSGNVLWAMRAGGTQSDVPAAICADLNGNSYIAAYFSDTTVVGNDTLVAQGLHDVLTFKLDANGNSLWAKKGGTVNYDIATSISTDNNGNCWVSGYFKGSASFGSVTINSYNSQNDYFLVKYDANGNVDWAVGEGGFGVDEAYGTYTDQNGNTYVTGKYFGTVIIGTDTLTMAGPGGSDIFLVKYDIAGNPVWASKAGGANNSDEGIDIALDGSGFIYLTGHFTQTSYFGNDTMMSLGSTDIFISRLDASGNFLWTKQAGNSSANTVAAIVADEFGNFYISGTFLNTVNFDTLTLTSQPSHEEPYVVKYNSAGSGLWAKNAGGNSLITRSYGLGLDLYGNTYIAGSYVNTVSFGAYTLTVSGPGDGYTAKIGCNYNLGTSVTETNLMCYQDQTGSASVAVSGGTGNINYLWNTSPSQDSAVAVNLSAGSYIVWVQDSNGCATADTANISQPLQLAVSTLATDASCFSCCDGSASATASGGTAGYTYLWSPGGNTTPTVNNACPGNYVVCIYDANGCSSCDSVTINFTTGVQQTAGEFEISIAPNPFNAYAEITVGNPEEYPNTVFILYNLAGKEVRKVHLNAEKTKVEKSDLPAGVYFYKIISNGERSKTGKIIIN